MIDLIISTLLILPAGAYLIWLAGNAAKTGHIKLPGSGQVILRKDDAKLFRFLCRIITIIGFVLLAGWAIQCLAILR